MHAMLGSAPKFSFFIKIVANHIQPTTNRLRVFSSQSLKTFLSFQFCSFLPFITTFHQLPSCYLTQPIRQPTTMSLGSQSPVFRHQSVPILSIHTATSHRTNCFLASHRIAGSDIPVCRREVAAKELQFTIGKLDVQNAPLFFHMHAALACYTRLNII